MITRQQSESAKKKLAEIKNRLIQLGLFVELDPIFNCLEEMNDKLKEAGTSTNSTSYSSSDDNSSTTTTGAFSYSGVDISNARETTLNNLKNQIESLLSDVESEVRNHL